MTETNKTKRRARLNAGEKRLQHPTLNGVTQETVKDLLQAEADRPLKGGDRDLPHTSLFGDGHRQKLLF
ncbi:MAG: hypothetical protein AB7F96_22735 [Beijerinckiaceae bacterium]